MKAHNRLTKYLVENHPLLFHSKFFQLLACGTLFWLFSFLIGYVSITKQVLINSRIKSYYFESMFVMFHVIACIIILSVWAIHFYKMKPLRNYYPLGKFYFTKLFFQLLLPFFLLVSAYLPYTSGAVLRGKAILPKEEFIKDKATFNLGYAFLITEPESYNFSQKIYPEPFPMKRGVYDRYEEEMRDYRSLYYSPDLLSKTYISHKELKNTPSLEYYLSRNDSLLKMNGKEIYFYESKVVYESEDSCQSNEVITKFIDLTQAQKKAITANGLLNFSISVMDSERYYSDRFPNEFEPAYNYSNYDSIFVKEGIPEIHNLVNNKDYVSIQQKIEEFNEALEKYKIKYYIDPELMVEYLKEKNFENFEYSMVKPTKVKDYEFDKRLYTENYEEDEIESEEVGDYSSGKLVTDKYETIEETGVYATKYSKLEKEILLSRAYFEKYELEKLNSNFNSIYSKNKDEGVMILAFLILAFFMVSFIVWFEFTEVKAFLISIPVGGVIAIVISLFIALGSAGGGSDSEGVSFFVLFCLTAIIVANVFYIYNPTSNKFVSSILMNLTYFIIHGYAWFVLMHINHVTTNYNAVDPLSKCGGSKTVSPFSFVETPQVFLVVTMVSVLLFYKLIPMWKAKKK